MQFTMNAPPFWCVEMTSAEVNAIAAAAAAIPDPTIKAAVIACAALAKFMDALGGNQGVQFTGVIGVAGVVCTPKLFEFYGFVAQAAGHVVVFATNLGKTILSAIEWIKDNISGVIIGALFPITGIFIILHDVWPWGEERGKVQADEDLFRDWEKLMIIAQPHVGPNVVSILTRHGYLIAHGHGAVTGDCTDAVDGATHWVMEHTYVDTDRRMAGTVAFRNVRYDRYLCALNGGDADVTCDRQEAHEWESWFMENHRYGLNGLRTQPKRKLMSIG